MNFVGMIVGLVLTALKPEERCLVLNVYWEAAAAGEPVAGMEAVAQVTLARVRDNRPSWGGGTICGVVFESSRIRGTRQSVAQFSWTASPHARLGPPHNVHDFMQAVAVAAAELKETAPIDDDLRLARYYLNPVTSARSGVCWFEKHLVPVKTVGHHRFYREPTTAEHAAGWHPHLSKMCAPRPRSWLVWRRHHRHSHHHYHYASR